MMRAALKLSKERLENKEVPRPKPGPNDCLVKVKACAICGSDTWWLEDSGPEDLIRGHEIAGIVEEVGKEVKYWACGDRVVIYVVIGCGKCSFCARGMPTYCLNPKGSIGYIKELEGKRIGGGFGEYLAIPANLLLSLPGRFDFVVGSLFTDTIGVPMRALRKAQIKEGDTVVIWGLGPMGLVAVQGAKVLGAERVIGIDLLDNRRSLAEKLGIDYTIDPQKEDPVKSVKKLTRGLGAQVAINTVARDDIAQMAYQSIRLNGVLVCIAGRVLAGGQDERRVTASWYFTLPEYELNIGLVKKGLIKLDFLVTHVYPLKDINTAFSTRFYFKDKSLKVIVTP